MKPLTKRRLEAIVEALTARLAGPIDIEADPKDYEAALEWAQEKLSDRARRAEGRTK